MSCWYSTVFTATKMSNFGCMFAVGIHFFFNHKQRNTYNTSNPNYMLVYGLVQCSYQILDLGCILAVKFISNVRFTKLQCLLIHSLSVPTDDLRSKIFFLTFSLPHILLCLIFRLFNRVIQSRFTTKGYTYIANQAYSRYF